MRKICGMTPEDIEALLAIKGLDVKYSGTIATDFYRRGIRDINKMQKIPLSVRKSLSSSIDPQVISPENKVTSADNSVKYLFRADNNRLFETVLIPDGKRRTVCVSTQSGCRMACPFCLTASIGFRGNLSAGEIIEQVLNFHNTERVTHVVFMGMGEPLDNTDEVLKACRILTAGWGLALSPRNITISTVGITKGVRRFLNESDCNLTLSLFSPFPHERAAVVPAEKANPSGKILEIMKDFKLVKKRRLTVAYVMIDGINDSDSHLDALRKLLINSSLRVNLLPYHDTGDKRYRSSDKDRMNSFRQGLHNSGISASVRKSRGSDISAACGMLASGLK